MSVSYHTAQLRLRGNIGSIDTKTLDSGLTIANVRLATDIGKYDKEEDEEVVRTEWHDLTFFGSDAEYIEQRAEPGDKICGTFEPYTSSWEDDDGNTQYNTEFRPDGEDLFIMASDGGAGGTTPEQQLENEKSSSPRSGGGGSNEPDDDLPF